jgi:hypothetical protein
MGASSSSEGRSEENDDEFDSGAGLNARRLSTVSAHPLFAILPLMQYISDYAHSGFCDLVPAEHCIPYDLAYSDQPVALLWPRIHRGTAALIDACIPCVIVGKTISSGYSFELIFPEYNGLDAFDRPRYSDLAARYEFMQMPDIKSCDCEESLWINGDGKIANVWEHEVNCSLRLAHGRRFNSHYNDIPVVEPSTTMRVRTLSISANSLIRLVERRDGEQHMLLVDPMCQRPQPSLSFPCNKTKRRMSTWPPDPQFYNRYNLFYELFSGDAMRIYYSSFAAPFHPQYTLGF